ncbi:MAG: hypothetical protein PHC37_06210 [Candidatus Omnitrophica bacterium]|nr:hypothetical protein [Candidatus Omnitrophota bacterium]MDD5691268.1 hypothetical protein [Candidatus Omnitrophota bacterium]
MRQKDLIELGITGILVTVLIIVFVNTFRKLHRPNIAAPKVVDLVNQPSLTYNKVDSKDLYDLLEQEAKSFDLKRDPFTAAPIIDEKNMQSGIALTGILWDKIKPLAIIDGEVVKKGDRFGNKVVVDIKRDRVILSDGQELLEIKLEP